ncbi:MAG: hypothetical protein JST04_13260 [Bdellovibrionales bacterium]|nr:hypothetical protein [Bdellovibrionales bacterium]
MLKKSIFALLSLTTAVGTLSPTVNVPTVHAQTAVQSRAIASDREILDAVYDLLASVQQVRQSIRISTRIGVNQKLNGRLQNFENSVSHIRNLVNQNASNYQIQSSLEDLKNSLLTMATDINLTVLALNTQKDWYQMVMDTGALIQAANGPRHKGGNGPVVVIEPMPNHPIPDGGRPGYEFSGAIQGNPVLFTGRTAQEFISSCSAYLQSANLSYVNKMSNSSGQSIASLSFGNYLSSTQMCAIALLNADSRGNPRLGKTELAINDVHFAISNSLSDAEVAELINVANFSIDYASKVTVNGQVYPLSFGNYYSAAAQKAVLRYNIAHPASITKKGTIQGRPFVFTGFRASEIQSQCLDYWQQVTPDYVASISVNGKTFSLSYGNYYNAASACMAITAAQ